ncbi:16S rRNA (cytidine(1402)-2'-O)-methyltransferase, partial [Pseudomonas aeruginosa]|nr:16S rRNA (cytidine(1402)-2'-O)-methyltransferase [Pseudomonas aeruginosa]
QEAPRPLLFSAAPPRLLARLAALRAVFGGERRAVLARALRPPFAPLRRLPLAALPAWVASARPPPRGACVVLVAGWQAPAGAASLGAAALRVLALLLAALPLPPAAALAAGLPGVRPPLLSPPCSSP